MRELKKCPFCGKDVAEITTAQEIEACENFEVCNECEYVAVVCNFNKGGCGAASGFRSSIEKALELWNRRAEE